MSDKVYLGNRLSDLDVGEPSMPVSKVILNVDSETYYQSGNDNGLTIEQDCPWATQEMADSILEKLRGFVYNPYSGNNAFLDPAAELGDAITVGGVYGILSTIGRNLDRQGIATVGAPKVDEIEDEYPYKTKERKKTDRTLAKARSLISKAADEIRLEVEGISGDVSSLKVTLEGVTISGPDGETYIKNDAIQTGSISADKLNLTGAITFGDLAVDVQNDINDAYSLAVDASNAAESAEATVGAWSYGNTTYIDGTKIMAGTVMASQLFGGSVSLLTQYYNIAGTMSITGASSANFAIDLTSYGGLRMIAETGAIWLDTGYTSLALSNTENAIWCYSGMFPFSDGQYFLGNAAHRWNSVYSATGTIQTSDRNKKHDIEKLPRKYVDMILWLEPKRFKMDDGTSGRDHVGFIAQDVEEGMEMFGIDPMEFGGWCKDVDDDGNVVYMLRYDEFIAILLAAIKDHETRLKKLEGVA